MKRLFRQKERICFYLGVILFLSSSIYAFWETKTPAAALAKQAEVQIQTDFDAVLAAIENQTKSPFLVCDVSYNKKGEIVQWTNNTYLPSLDTLKECFRVWNHEETILETSDRIYYVIPIPSKDSLIKYTLIPLYVRYKISNNYLPPYLFLGNYYDTETANSLSASISTQKPTGDSPFIKIRNKRGAIIFYISNLDETIIRGNPRLAVVSIGFLGLVLLLLGLYQLLHNEKKWELWKCDLVLVVLIILLRIFLSVYQLPYSYAQIPLFSSGTIALEYAGIMIPSLGDFLLDVLLIYLICWSIYRVLFDIHIEKFYQTIAHNVVFLWLICTAAIGVSALIIKEYQHIIQLIFENSQLKIDFSNILAFSQSYLSQFLLLGLGILLLGTYLIISSFLKLVVLAIKSRGLVLQTTMILLFLLLTFGICAWIYKANITDILIVFTTLSLWGVIVYLHPNRIILQYDLLNYIIFIGACSLLLCVQIVNYNFDQREKNVEVIEEHTFQDRQKSIYFAFDHALSNFENDSTQTLTNRVAKEFQKNKDYPEQFLKWFEKEYFTQYFEDTQLAFFLFDLNDKRLSNPGLSDIKPSNQNFSLININDNAHVVSEELDNGFYRVKNYDTETYDDIYVSIFTMGNLKFQLQIYPTRFDVSRVFPSLLQDKDSRKGAEELKEYDAAFYRNDILLSSIGSSTFPQKVKTRTRDSIIRKTIISDDKHHKDYLFAIDTDKSVMIRYTYPMWTDYVMTLSLIFFFFGIFTILSFICYLLINKFFSNYVHFSSEGLQFKFHVLLLGLSGFILLVISVFLLYTIRNRFYAENLDTLHQEMLSLANAINIEYKDVRNRPDGEIDDAEVLKDLNLRLIDLGNKTTSDMNIYDSAGYLIATNQPLIQEVGISSGLMNSEAFAALSNGKQSESFMQEYIGNTEFLSAYKSIYLGDKFGTVYLNVPYFDKTEELNRKTTNLLGFIISILLLLIILVSFITIYISRYFTSPLKLIQERLSQTQFGDINIPIEYQQKDEIGAIVNAYNQMLEKLKASEKSLAQNERDLAWRQMAKQVAHEIKNPLTPMKLSIQHLTRAWNEKNLNLEKMFPKVTNTILIQIDSLSRIADNFSEFARMPDTVKNNFVLNEVLREVVILYNQNDHITIKEQIEDEPFEIYADRDQISRVFNNLLKNGIQAIENKDEVGHIEILMEVRADMAHIRISDNGCGMTEEVKKRAFEPNFSTKSSGMGLGLAMSKRIIEIAQGEIRYESIEGEGTTFYVELPRSKEI